MSEDRTKIFVAVEVHKLDNPVWHSLNEVHKDFAVEYEGIKFYQPDYCPFGGYIDHALTASGIEKYFKLTTDFYIVGEKPCFDSTVTLKKELICNQMILDKPIDFEISEEIIRIENDKNDELFSLVNMVQPGYFRSKTSQMGSYYGIIKNGELIAVTGERMKMNSYTEVSAVVTHSNHTGKGYAKQLVAHTVNKIFDENKIPYLHVAERNTTAVKLYEKLGFWTRRKMSFWNFTV